ncbi:MAG TPA: phosphate ABC transporter substrate-binding protein PstS [Candidatus Dormibacteraeota bacterium]|nr:phosphate ABC transporter substrate-binding protein PstS [Candidatus Dormibacteraeota bacterium]
MKNRADLARSVTAVLLVISSFAIFSPNGLAQTQMVLVATGSTMPAPLYVLWGDEYHKVHPETEIRYLAVGTSESANRVLSGSGGDLGGGDAPIPEKQLKEAAHAVVELPTVLVGIAIFYNLPGNATSLRLSGPVLANIYLGKITFWSDPEIAKLNDGKLPHLPIKVLHRTDGKGSNYILSDFLSKLSPEFRARVGTNVSPKWPVGTAFSRCEDLLANVAKTPGAIGYAELRCGEKSGLATARIRNADGEFVKPSAKSISDVALAMESKMADDFRVSLTNAPGKESYPIVSFTWFYVPAGREDLLRSQAVKEYLSWVYGGGQEIAQAQGYPKLPPSVLQKVRAKVASLH